MCVRRARGADGADGDASEAERRGGAFFIERPLLLLAPPPLASLFAKASAPPRRFPCRRMVCPCILSCRRAVLSFVILLHSVYRSAALFVYAFDRVKVFEDGPENRILESTYYTRAARKINDLADTAIIKLAP